MFLVFVGIFVLQNSQDEDDVQDVIKKMAPCGVETIVVDLKKEIAEGAFEAWQAGWFGVGRVALKNDGWKISLSFWGNFGLFSGANC